MILQPLFSSLADFRTKVPGVDSGISFSTLEANAISAKKRITGIISTNVYDKIISGSDENMKEHLRIALGNATAAEYMLFAVVDSRKNDVDIYRYEAEGMYRSWMKNFSTAMDDLLDSLDASDMEEWKSTPWCKLRSSLRLKTTNEFDTVYSIDNSSLFFYRTISIQHEILLSRLSSYYSRFSENSEVVDMLNIALAKLVVAKAIKRIDPMELPVTIRNLTSTSEVSRNKKEEQSRLLDLAASLESEVDSQLKDIDFTYSAKDNVETETSFNRESDKFYLMP